MERQADHAAPAEDRAPSTARLDQPHVVETAVSRVAALALHTSALADRMAARPAGCAEIADARPARLALLRATAEQAQAVLPRLAADDELARGFAGRLTRQASDVASTETVAPGPCSV